MAEAEGEGGGGLERVSKVSESDLTLRMVSLEWDLIWPLNDQMLFTREFGAGHGWRSSEL